VCKPYALQRWLWSSCAAEYSAPERNMRARIQRGFQPIAVAKQMNVQPTIFRRNLHARHAKCYRSATWPHQPGNRAQQRGFSSSIRAAQGDMRPARKRNGKTADQAPRAAI
jgi:hypothetical protein